MLPEETSEAIRKEVATAFGALLIVTLVFVIGSVIGFLFGRFL